VTSEAAEILKRSRKPTALWKKLAAFIYGVALVTIVVSVLSDELWNELRIPIVPKPSMEEVKWALLDEEAEEAIVTDPETGVIIVNSQEMLESLLPSPGLVLLTWSGAVILVTAAGAGLAVLVLRLGYFRGRATIATLLFFTLFGLTMVVPFVWMISMSLKHLQETSLSQLDWVPWPIRWRNFREVFDTVPYGRFYLNSLFIASYVTVGLIFTSSLAAYSFARLNFPFRDKLFLAYLATMMIPGAVTSIPVFVLMCKIGWVDSYKAIIIPGIFSAYGTFMLRQFFMTLPRDLEDAAKIDGCSLFGIFIRIILPLSKPALATLTIFTFMGSWRNFMWPLIILNDPNKMPLPVGLQFFASSEAPDPNVMMAATMMMILPVIIVFLLGQRYFVEGIQLGAIKG
jgi:multiple sugar transport system permease protein